MTTNVILTPQWQSKWDELWKRSDLREVRIAVAYCSRNGAKAIKKSWNARKPKLQLLVGLNDGVTDIFAREILFDWSQENSQIEVRGKFKNAGRFHPKVYTFIYDNRPLS